MFQFKFVDGFLNKEECKLILDYSLNNIGLSKAKIITDSGPVIDQHRKSKIGFDKYLEFDFLNKKVLDLVLDNICVNGHDIGWNDRGYQFTLYETGDYFNWHTDYSNKRYCSVIIQLNEDYEGGELELNVDGKMMNLNKGAGNCVIFLSDTNHRVTEILRGTRYSLVNWLVLSQKNSFKKSII
jgi:hypothetical protein